MKRLVLSLCLMASVISLYAQAPQWVTRRPVADGKYVGIGMASLSDPDCRNVAVNNAMLDIASQISVNIESSSFMRSEERRVGKECLHACRSRWSPYH